MSSFIGRFYADRRVGATALMHGRPPCLTSFSTDCFNHFLEVIPVSVFQVSQLFQVVKQAGRDSTALRGRSGVADRGFSRLLAGFAQLSLHNRVVFRVDLDSMLISDVDNPACGLLVPGLHSLTDHVSLAGDHLAVRLWFAIPVDGADWLLVGNYLADLFRLDVADGSLLSWPCFDSGQDQDSTFLILPDDAETQARELRHAAFRRSHGDQDDAADQFPYNLRARVE